MNMSKHGMDLLKLWEGFERKQYKDSAGLPTIGVGHLLTKAELRSGCINIGGTLVAYAKGLTDDQVLTLLDRDNNVAEGVVTDHVKVPLSQSQFDALASFAFNCGDGAFIGSTLLKRLNKGEYFAVPEELKKWIHAGGKVDRGLIKRRDNEIKLWRGLI